MPVRGEAASPDDPQITYLRKVKRPTGSGLWPAYRIASDQFGTWFYTPRHSRYRGEDGIRTEVCEVAQDAAGIGEHALHLAPASGWWFATWRRGGFLSADVCTPAVLRDDEWVYIDLELDPFRTPDGTVGTEDADELADAVAAGLVGDDEHRAADAAARWLERAFTAGTEPFGEIGWQRLESLVADNLPPLVDFGAHPEIYLPPDGSVTATPPTIPPDVDQYR